ncbi:hypothetical protein D3C87_1944660 [compost metagenome]
MSAKKRKSGWAADTVFSTEDNSSMSARRKTRSTLAFAAKSPALLMVVAMIGWPCGGRGVIEGPSTLKLLPLKST